MADQVIEVIIEQIRRKNRSLQLKPALVKSGLWVFVNTLIENPAFDSQTKETLTTRADHFGSNFELSEGFLRKVITSGIAENAAALARAREQITMARSLSGGRRKAGRLLGVPKLEDANLAGTAEGEECTLILTEGDSAKTLAMAGIEVVGRDRFGVFPLRGKLLNVRDASAQ